MLQYKIPQNVGIEDRIVGPLSLRQLLILGVGFGVSYVIFTLTSRIYALNVLEYIIISLPTLIALAAALIKIRNVTFAKFILLTLEFAINPRKRYWDHRGIALIVDPDLTSKIKQGKKNEQETSDQKRKNVNLSELSATLDSGGFLHLEEEKHDDLDQVNDDDLITQAYFGHRRSEGLAHNMYWRTRDVQKKKLDILAKLPTVSPSTPAETNPSKAQGSDLPDLQLPIKNRTGEHKKSAAEPLKNPQPNEQKIEPSIVNTSMEKAEEVLATSQKPEILESKITSDLKKDTKSAPIIPTKPQPLVQDNQPKRKKRRRKRKNNSSEIENSVKVEKMSPASILQSPEKMERQKKLPEKSSPHLETSKSSSEEHQRSTPPTKTFSTKASLPPLSRKKESNGDQNELKPGDEIEFNLD